MNRGELDKNEAIYRKWYAEYCESFRSKRMNREELDKNEAIYCKWHAEYHESFRSVGEWEISQFSRQTQHAEPFPGMWIFFTSEKNLSRCGRARNLAKCLEKLTPLDSECYFTLIEAHRFSTSQRHLDSAFSEIGSAKKDLKKKFKSPDKKWIY